MQVAQAMVVQSASAPEGLSRDDLQRYYRFLYPANLLCSWFGYLKDENTSNVLLSRRQFSMTLQIGDQEIYKRYLSFRSAKDFQQALVNDVPVKMDIGAIYEETPKKGAINVPQQKEFVLDIDIDSYDNVRTCCSGPELCLKCWKLMRVAGKILYRTMYEDFGYKDMLFVFSGRRGMHLWVCDEKARNLTDLMRRSLMEYMYLVSGNEQSNSQLADYVLKERNSVKGNLKFSSRKVMKEHYHKYELHPFVAKSLAIIEKAFFPFLEENQVFLDPRRVPVLQKILGMRSKILLQNVEKRWVKCKDSISMYEAITQELESYERYTNDYKVDQQIPPLNRNDSLTTMSYVEQEIMLTFMYPRLDINVSTSKNHLLKCPFSVHPKSKMISVPFDYDSIDRFDPTTVIKLPTLLEQAESLTLENGDKYPTPELLSKATNGLAESMNALEKFVKRTLLNLRKENDLKKLQM